MEHILSRLAAVLFFLVLINSAVTAQTNLNASADNLFFLESPQLKGLERQKIASCENLLVREMNLAGRQLPRVLVLHVSEDTGKALQLHTSIRRNSDKNRNDVYYEFWIVGPGRAGDYAVAVQALLQEHFGLQMTDAERTEIVLRVLRILNATVSAYGQ